MEVPKTGEPLAANAPSKIHWKAPGANSSETNWKTFLKATDVPWPIVHFRLRIALGRPHSYVLFPPKLAATA